MRLSVQLNITFNMDNFKKVITPNTKVISIAEITNVIGDKRDIKEIAKIAHENDIKVLDIMDERFSGSMRI